jgi:type II secretory pathway component PulM
MDGSTHPHSARTGSEDPSIREILLSHTALLRGISEQLTALTKAVTPPPKEGPTLDEMLMAIITLLREQGVVLTRVDDRTLALGVDLPPLIARAMLRGERDRDLRS